MVVFWGKMMNNCKFMNSGSETNTFKTYFIKQMNLICDPLFTQGSQQLQCVSHMPFLVLQIKRQNVDPFLALLNEGQLV